METYRQADVREVEDILRRIEVAENTGNSSEIADMLAEDAVIMVPNHKYLFLYSRAADGSWKIARAIVNLDDHDGEDPAE